MQELNELLNDPSPEFKAEPLESDVFEWHFSIRYLLDILPSW